MLPVLIFTSILTLFFFGFNGEQIIDATAMTGTAIAVRAGKSFSGLLTICGSAYGLQSLLDGEVPTLQSEEFHIFASNGTFAAYAHDPLKPTILEDPATAFWYPTRQTPAPYINPDGTPWGHTAPFAKKVEDPDAIQNMMNFAFFGFLVGIFVYLCLQIFNKIFRLIFEGNWSQIHTQDAVGFHTLNVNPINQTPVDTWIKDSLDRILDTLRTTPTRPEVRLGSSDLGSGHRDTIETIRSEITSKNIAQSQASSRLLTRMEGMEERICGRLQESDTEVQRSFRVVRRLVEAFNRQYENDQSMNNTNDEDVRTRLENLDAQIQVLNRNVERLNLSDQNSRITSMDAKIERLINNVNTWDLLDRTQNSNKKVEELDTDRLGALERKMEHVTNSVKAIDPNYNLQTLEAKYEQLSQLVGASNSNSGVSTFDQYLDQVRDQTSKALTVDSLEFKNLNDRVGIIQTQVTGVSLDLTKYNTLTEGLNRVTNQKVENLEEEIQKLNNSIGKYQTLEAKIDGMQTEMRDSFTRTARQSDVRLVIKKVKDIQEGLQTAIDMPERVQKIQKDISKLSNLGVDVRSMFEKFEDMQGKLQIIMPIAGEFKEMQKEMSNLSNTAGPKIGNLNEHLGEDVRSSNERLDEMQRQINSMPGELEKLDKETQGLIRQNYDSVLSRLEASQCNCQTTSTMTQEDMPKTNRMPGTVHDLRQEVEDIQEVQKVHTSAVSKLEADLRDLDSRLISQATRADGIERVHEERLDRHEESLCTHQNTLNTHGETMSVLRIGLDRIEEENEKNLEAPRRKTGRVDVEDDSVKELVQSFTKQAIDSYVTKNWDELKPQLDADLRAQIKELDLKLWEQRFDYVKRMIGTFEKCKCKCNLGGLEDRVRKFEDYIEKSGCTCNPADFAGNVAGLERVNELMAENYAKLEKKTEDRLTTLEENLDSFEEARAKDGVQLEDVDGRLRGIEDQTQKTNDLFFQRISSNIRTRSGNTKPEITDQKIQELANMIQKEGIVYAIRQMMNYIDGLNKGMHSLRKTVRGHSSIEPVGSIFEQLDTIRTELGALSYVYNLPAVQKVLQEIDQAESPTLAFMQSYDQLIAPPQQTPAPFQSDAPMVPQSSPVSQPISGRQLSDADEVPAEMRAILAHGPRHEDSPVSYASQSNQPSTSTQTALLQQFSPTQQYSTVLQTATIPGWVSVDQQDSPPYQPHAQDNTVSQTDITSEEQTTEPQDKPVNMANRKIKVPISRRKSYHKQQQLSPNTDLTFQFQQQLQQLQQPPATGSQPQPQPQQQQQQPKPAQQDQQDTQTLQPLKFEDMIDESMLVDPTATDTLEITAQPPSPPPSPPQVGPEAQAMLEPEAAERAQPHGTYDELFDDFFDDDAINTALDEEEKRQEEKEKEGGKNHTLSLPGNVQTANVLETTQPETSQAATQGPSQSQEGSSYHGQWIVSRVQRDVLPPAEKSKSVKTSQEQKNVGESIKQQNKSSNVTPSISKQTDNKSRSNSNAIPIKAPEEKGGEDDGYWQKALPPLPPLDKDFKRPDPKEADNKPQGITTSNPATTSKKTPAPARPTRPTSSPFLGQSKSRSQLTDRLRGAASKSQGTSLSASQWAKEDDSASIDPEISDSNGASGKQKEVSKAAEQISSKEEAVEGWDNPEIRHNAALEVLSSYKGMPLSASRWADESKENVESSKEEKPRDTVKEKFSGEARQEDKVTSDNTSSSPAEGLDDQKVRHRTVVDGSEIYKGPLLSATQWADDESKEQMEPAPTPKSETKDSPTVQAKEKEKSGDGTLPGTPDKWNQWASSTCGVKSSPAMITGERQAECRAVKDAFATVRGTRLSSSRWASKEDRKKDTVRTPKRESEGSPFQGRGQGRGSGGGSQVCDANLIDRFPNTKKGYIINFDRIKGEGEDVAAENSATSTPAEGGESKMR